MSPEGSLIRLYPVPFRLIDDEKKFKKWQWVTARIEKSNKDHRPESHKVYVDTIQCEGKPLSTVDNWHVRRSCLNKTEIYSDFADLENVRERDGLTLGLLRPAAITGLDISPAERPHWTDAEKAKLIQLQQQGDLFDGSDAKSLTLLKKVPFDFHYRYLCETISGPIEYRHKIVDWEVAALYWNVRRSHGENWQTPFEAKLNKELPNKDLLFLMGTIHRFPNQWLIVSLIYPPKQLPEGDRQGSLF